MPSLYRICETTAERWWLICDAQLWLLAVRAGSRLRNKLGVITSETLHWRGGCFAWVVMVWRVRIWTFDLDEAFRANRLLTAAGSIQVGRVIHEADWAF